MNRKSSESARLVTIKSRLEELLTPDLFDDLHHLAERAIGGNTISLNQLEDGLKALLGEAPAEFLLSMVCQADIGPLNDMCSVVGLDTRIESCLRKFVCRWGGRLENHIRGKVLCGWRPWIREDPRGRKDLEIHLSTLDGHQFHCQLDRRRSWALIGELMSCLARGGELPDGLKPEIIERFLSAGEAGQAD